MIETGRIAHRVEQSGSDLGHVFLGGFESCTSEHLSLADGTSAVRLTNTATGASALSKVTPPDAFGVVICLDAQDCDVRYGRRTVRSGHLPAGCVSFENPGEDVSVSARGSWDTLFFFLSRDMVRQICDATGSAPASDRLEFFNPPVGTEPAMLDFARRVRGEIGGTDAFARLRVDLIAQDLAIHMLRHHSSVADALRPARPSRRGLAPLQLHRAFEAMDGLLEGDVTLAALARAADCSPTHFSRAFKRSTGVPPFAWLLKRRVERAQVLLRTGNMPIAQVALAVGFSAQPQFTTAFKRVTGVTPAAWRRSRI